MSWHVRPEGSIHTGSQSRHEAESDRWMHDSGMVTISVFYYYYVDKVGMLMLNREENAHLCTTVSDMQSLNETEGDCPVYPYVFG